MWLSTSTSTRSMRPTKPRSVPSWAACLATRNSRPSSPQRPTAGCPWRLRRSTMSLLTLPTRTIFATSTVSASLTRSPPTNCTGSPRRSMKLVISGPPPCTTIGLIPTYLSSTTSRANSSRRAGSSIAAPPYLMTTVLPWNSRMYGSASRRVATSRTVSGRVVGIDRHVAVGQVGEEDLGLVALSGKADDVLDLLAPHALGERRQIERPRRAARADGDALDRDVQLERRGVGERAADGLGDPAPVGVAAVEGRLDERRVRHAAGRLLDGDAVAAGHDHAADALGALAVAHDRERELAQKGVEGLAERELVRRLGLDPHAARAAGHEQDRVVRRELAVDADAVERALDRPP